MLQIYKIQSQKYQHFMKQSQPNNVYSSILVSNNIQNKSINSETGQQHPTKNILKLESIIKEDKQNFIQRRHQLQLKQNQLLPLLSKAHQAINRLESQNIMDIKSSKRQPQLLAILMDCLAIFFHLKLTPIIYTPQLQVSKNIIVPFWKNSFQQSGKYIMGPNFDIRRRLIQFERNSINGETIQLLEPLLVYGSHWLNPKELSRISSAGESVCTWVYCMYSYYHKIERMKKQMDELNKFQLQLGVKNKQLDQLRAEQKSYQFSYQHKVQSCKNMREN